MLNVVDFGAVNNASVDSCDAIQAAIDAAGTSGSGTVSQSPVYFPPGTYRIDKPLVVDTSSAVLRGAGRGCEIRCGGQGGPAIVMCPKLSAQTTGAPLVGSTGVSLYFEGNGNLPGSLTGYRFFNLRESYHASLDGLSQLCVQGWWKADTGNTAANRMLASSSGTRLAGEAGHVAFSIYMLAGGYLNAALTLKSGSTVTTHALTTGAGTVVDGSNYHVALTYDGSTMRLFLNGAVVASLGGISGTVVQAPCEEIIYPGPSFQVFPQSLGATAQWRGWVDSFEIANTARHTAAFTPPTAKCAASAGT